MAKPNINIKQSAGIVDKDGKAFRSFDAILKATHCNFKIHPELPAIEMRDISTGELKFVVVEDGSLSFYDTYAEVCTAKNS